MAQESLFMWYELPTGKKVVHMTGKVATNWPIVASAFTVAELGEMLPETVTSSRLTCEGDEEPTWFVEYDAIRNRCFTEETESDARAKMLIYLLENKIITT